MKKQTTFAIFATASLCLILAADIKKPAVEATAEAAAPSKCRFDENTYTVGEQWKLNRCTNCLCGPDARSSCFVFDCFITECVDFEYSFDDCCPKCPNGANCFIEGHGIVPAGKTVETKNGLSCTCHAKAAAEQTQFPPLPPLITCINTTTCTK